MDGTEPLLQELKEDAVRVFRRGSCIKDTAQIIHQLDAEYRLTHSDYR